MRRALALLAAALLIGAGGAARAQAIPYANPVDPLRPQPDFGQFYRYGDEDASHFPDQGRYLDKQYLRYGGSGVRTTLRAVPPERRGPSAGREAKRPPLVRTRDLFATLQRCWDEANHDPGSIPAEVTLRFAFRRDGMLLGEPRVTYAKPGRATKAGRAAIEAAQGGLRACLPLPLDPSYAPAIAGRPFAVRFIAAPRGPALKETRS